MNHLKIAVHISFISNNRKRKVKNRTQTISYLKCVEFFTSPLQYLKGNYVLKSTDIKYLLQTNVQQKDTQP